MPRWFALVLCAVGAVAIVAGLRQSTRGKETRGWTRTHGRVVAAYVEEIPGPAEEGGTRYRPVVRYAYEARGHAYQSEQVSVGLSPVSTSTDRDEVRRSVEPFPAGRDVDVWFDPGDPRQAVLVRGVPQTQVVAGVVIGIVLIGIGVFVLAR